MKTPALVDLAFPGSVIILKFIVKLMVDQQVNGVDFLRSLLLLPIDISFLSMSFGAAVLRNVGASERRLNSTAIFAFAVACISVAIFTTFLSKRSERAFGSDKTWTALGYAALGYVVSVGALFGSSFAGDFLP